MPFLPRLSANELTKFVIKLGYEEKRQKGSHISFKKEGCIFNITIPNHKEIDRGTLASILRQLNLSNEEFLKLYNQNK